MRHAFTLYYWPVPFRAQVLRYMLAHAGAAWDEAPADRVAALHAAAVPEQPVPFMGPPVLHDHAAGKWLSQTPAIALWLAPRLRLLPEDSWGASMSIKVLCDTIDVLHEMTRNCGMMMWTEEDWARFAETRLPRWLSIFEETGRRHGLSRSGGTLLGTPAPGLADLATAALWATIRDCLPQLSGLLSAHAPAVMALSARIADSPAIAALRAEQAKAWGDAWCGGQIEASLRHVLDRWAGKGGKTTRES